MKIITLNSWSGRVGAPLLNFLKKYKDIDIFCLQEVDLNGYNLEQEFLNKDENKNVDPLLFETISNILVDHHGYFCPQLGEWFGTAIFIKKELCGNVTETGNRVVSDRQQQHMEYKTWFRRTIQWIDFTKNNKNYTIINFWGYWIPNKGKGDNPDRIEQSENILKFLETKKERNIILAGDFNLSPNTESLRMIENFPLQNLIKEYGITDTRTSIYKKENRFADYILSSPAIIVKEFKVLPEEVSDHAALYLEIE